MKLRLRGDYHYGGCELSGVRYAVIWNGPEVERVREITPEGNPVVWRSGEPMTTLAMAVIAAST